MATYKLNLIEYWQVGELESWYKHMAAKGFHFQKAGRIFTKFKKGAAKQVDYRIELTPKQSIPEEQLHMYEDSGWDYVSSYQYFHVFCAPESRQAPEIHSDPVEQAETYKQFSRVLKRNFYLLILFCLLILPLQIYNLFIDSAPFYRFVNGDLISQWMVIVFVFVTLFEFCRSFYKIKKIEKRLKEGYAIEHNVSFKRYKSSTAIFTYIIVTIVLLNFAFLTKQITANDRQTLTTQADDLPIVRIEALDPGLEKDSHSIDDVDYGNMIESNWSIFAPIQYEVRESSISTTLTNDGEPYAPSITNDYYELQSDKLVRPFIESLIERYRYEGSREQYVEYDSHVFDVIIVYDESEYYKQLFVAKGHKVLKVTYYGSAPLDELITATEQAFQK
ncbi:MAG: DUF2812 domain-containing protein [Lysinibacillus sp.]